MTELQFRSFLVLAEELNFTKASKRLCITQSTLSSHISSLEKNLGISLFIRTNKSVELSQEGKHLYPFLSQAWGLINKGIEEAKEIHDGHANILRVGFINGLRPEFMVQVKAILDQFCQNCKDVKIQLFALNEKEMVELLESKQIDTVFTIEGITRIKPEYKLVPVAKNPIGILYSTNLVKSGEAVSLEFLKEQTMIVMSKETAPSEEYILREFQERMGIEFANILRVNSNEARVFQIYSGQGIGFSDAATRCLYEKEFQQYIVDEFYVNYGFVCREHTKNELVRALFSYVKETAVTLEFYKKQGVNEGKSACDFKNEFDCVPSFCE